jgi:hypothetical protein
MGACLRVTLLFSVKGSRREKYRHLLAVFGLRIVIMLQNPDGGQLSLFFTGGPTDAIGAFPNELKGIGKMILAR